MAFIGEAALSAFFEALFDKIISSSRFEFVTEKRVRKEIMSWETKLRTIHDVLADAEEKQMKNKAVEIWLADLRDLAYDIDDILDEFATEAALARKGMKEHRASTSKAQKLVPSSIISNYKMMSKIKKITARLEGLAKGRIELQLANTVVGRLMTTQNRSSPSTSLVDESDVFGRKEDKEKLLDLVLSNDGTEGGGIAVIPIVGMGGIGKTTLAQLVYNETKYHFDTHAWVCVSEEFDIINVTKIILQSVTSESCNSNDLNLLQVKLKERLSGKKFLIVLDDIWNKSYDDWTKLRSPFVVGAPGSKIIVTTRDFDVSSIMKTVPNFSLEKLSEDESLSLLAHHALGVGDFSNHTDLKETGLQIVKKCDGLPLATKTVGGLLRSKMDHDAWKEIAASEIWDLPEENNGIVPALKLSYYHLSSQLKQCFAYCSIVPKDYEFMEDEIVRLWMAEGFLNGGNTKKEIEDLGRRCFKELVSRSLFQQCNKKNSHFAMHDLINDLARSIAGKVCFRMEGHQQMVKFSGDLRHSSYTMDWLDGIKKFESLSDAKRLRTFLPFWMKSSFHKHAYLSNNVLIDLLPRLKCLRVLSLKRYYITEIPSFIGNFKHLRYLDFSYTMIKGLPNSLCTLYNLETLLLRNCYKIEKLPSEMELLHNLCHLDIDGAHHIIELPLGIGKLTNLRTLSKFIVGKGNGLNIREMKNLSNLKGRLSITELQNVEKAQFAREVELSRKSDFDDLEMEWSRDFDENWRKKEVEREVLNLLQPHEELKALAIRYYAGVSFPIWIEDPSFKNLQSLKIIGCQNCKLLPAVGRLPLLKELHIKGMSSVVGVGSEFYGENWLNSFLSLETLHFEDMPEWKEWKPCEEDEQGKKFQCLKELFIKNCPKLIKTLSDGLPSLEKLVIYECGELVLPISNLPMLCELDINGCKEVVLGSYGDLCLLKKIIFRDISKFTCVAKETMMLESTTKVADLKIIGGWEELASLWQTKWGWLAPLRSLRIVNIENLPQEVACIGVAKAKEVEKGEVLQLDIPCNIEYLGIRDCEGLEKLSKSLHNLTCVSELQIYGCPKFVSLLTNCLPLTLKRLVIQNCENLRCLFDDDGESINFRSTSLLESLLISDCEALKSILVSGWLPIRLKSLEIYLCSELELVEQEIEDNTCCLESITIWGCKNIKCLPQGLNKLSHLQNIYISNCPNLVCFPESGLSTTANLRSLQVRECEKLEALPSNLYSLQLQELHILRCPRVKYFIRDQQEGGLPTNLTLLRMEEPKISKAVMEWGLHRLTSLTDVIIDGGNCIDAMSFPMNINMRLPPSLTHLTIHSFENLRELSLNAFQNLTSLRSLTIYCCPKLKSLLPRMELMLPSLLELSICDCPELEKRCKKDKGKQWSNIAHIPKLQIGLPFLEEELQHLLRYMPKYC